MEDLKAATGVKGWWEVMLKNHITGAMRVFFPPCLQLIKPARKKRAKSPFHRFLPPSHHINTSQQSIIDKKTFYYFSTITTYPPWWKADYESSPNINETEYHQIHPYVRSGFSYQNRDRARHRNSFGNIITQSERDREQLDYADERNREAEVNFYDNKYYDNFKMHRWVKLKWRKFYEFVRKFHCCFNVHWSF